MFANKNDLVNAHINKSPITLMCCVFCTFEPINLKKKCYLLYKYVYTIKAQAGKFHR